jgi:hypothetical protein
MADDPFAPLAAASRASGKAARASEWIALTPVPADAPPPPASHPKRGRPSFMWAYRDGASALLGCVARFDPPSGKVVLPLTYCEGPGGRREWRWLSWPTPRPLYGRDALALRPDALVVVVEGEKAADAARRVYPDAVIVTSPGGSKSAAKIDWSALWRRTIVIWPDADAAGLAYAKDVARLALEAGAKSVATIAPPAGVSVGWDAADAEAEGWTAERVGALIASAEPVATAPAEAQPKTAKTKGEDRRPRRIPQRETLGALIEGVTLWCSPENESFAVYEVNGHRETWPVRSQAFRRWLAHRAYRETGTIPSSQALEDFLRIVEARATMEGLRRTPWLRVGATGGTIYIDLCNERWECVEIGPHGWRVRPIGDLPFIRSPAMRALPDPEEGWGIEVLRGYLNCSDNDFILFVAWIVGAMRAAGPYPALIASGEQGSGKSSASRLARSLVDPNAAPLRAAPRDDRDLLVAALNAHVLGFDNFSQIPTWLSDALCRLATGGGFATRLLHSDKDEQVFQATRPILINGIGSLADRADLADRAIVIRLNTIPETERLAEDDIEESLARDRPRIFGALLTALCAGVRNLPDVKLSRKPRMADFAKWATACESGLGWEPGAFLDAYMTNQRDSADGAFEADAVATAVNRFISGHLGHFWTGTATELLELLGALVSESVKKSRAWPITAQGLGNRLERAAPGLRAHGVSITRKHSGVRLVTITKADAAGAEDER